MPPVATNALLNARLNDLLIDIGRSLLQYTSESWPWAGSRDEKMRHSIERMAAEQRDVVGAVADLLADSGEVIDFGSYPTKYTSLNYVAVDFLLSQLIANQKDVVKECEAVAAASTPADEAHALLSDVVLSERKHLDELQKLAADRGA